MKAGFRLPMFVVAAALVAMIAVLATLQYRWLGRISDSERERMTANLRSQAAAFAHEFDRELTLAYLTFQLEPLSETDNTAARLASRHERWMTTARHPRLVKDVYVTVQTGDGRPVLQRFDPATRFVEPVEWPENLGRVREALAPQRPTPSGDLLVVRSIPASIWEDIPALLVPSPVMVFNERVSLKEVPPQSLRMLHTVRFAILVLDRDYISREMLPAMTQHQFRATASAPDYKVAVINKATEDVIYKSAADFAPGADIKADATIDLFQVRPQEFASLATEVRKFSATVASRGGRTGEKRTETVTHVLPRDGAPVSILLQQNVNAMGRAAVGAGGSSVSRGSAPRWRLVVKHPSGSLETAVNAARRRNLLVSSSVLALLGISVGFLVVTTRRAQNLARQQMEFVAAVSHELRTPLAVIRSAADNLAEGVVHDEGQVRKYGELVRSEGRRLTEMVEQILELAGIHSGQRGFALRPVAIGPLLHEVLRSSSVLTDDAQIEVEFDVPETLPPALGDEPALRRVFQNLISNAIKYGAQGRWIGLKARAAGSEIVVSVSDRGAGIAPAEQLRIFEPFYRSPSAVDAQIQGAGLGLSLVQRIVEAHGGRITVQSTAGSGSEFNVHLPAATEEPITRSASSADAASLPTRP